MTNPNKIKVLIVDDSDIIKHSLRVFFNDYNFEVFVSNDGLEGIEKARLNIPTLILLDLMMPNFDGLKMLQVLKVLDDLKEIPVIVISGNTSKQNVLRAIEAGAVKVLSKPLHKELLKKAIREVLGDEILDKSKKNTVHTSQSDEEIAEQMKKFFLNSFTPKMEVLKGYIEAKNKQKSYEIIHQLKGAGTTAGFPTVTEISAKIEELLHSDTIPWEKVTELNAAMLKTFDEIETEVGV